MVAMIVCICAYTSMPTRAFTIAVVRTIGSSSAPAGAQWTRSSKGAGPAGAYGGD